MQAAVFRALEFDRVRESLAEVTLTSLGRERALALEPAVEIADVRARLDLTADAVRFVKQGGSLALSAPEDLPAILAALDVEDQPLDPLQLLGLSRLMQPVDTIVKAIRARTPGVPKAESALASFGTPGVLLHVVTAAASFSEETAAVARAIEPAGDVSDRASPALRDIRDSLRRQRAQLRATLDKLTKARETSKYLQDQIVTDRNGRYVVVVRAEHRDSIPGIVHGSSTSGASVYLEPMPTVSLNNEIVTLVEKEKAEIHRILLALTNAFRLRGDELVATLEAAAELDELYAKADMARRMDGVAPELTDDGRLEFRDARHPLLIPAVRELTEERSGRSEDQKPPPAVVVASDLVIVPPSRALVISGPNTGGKTVALKAMGLLSLMAQAGLLIPVATGSRFTPFRSMFADIGDEQSISASLSTFSGHIANIVAMDRALEAPALVLLDEVGGGTDPVEGGALGIAIVDHFRRRGAVVVATTHDDTLKSYAATTEGAASAGFGFNPDTYAPTYRLVYGTPGRSLAFEIAERLGMPARVVADARTRRSGRESQLAAHLARVDKELAAIERDRQSVQALRQSVDTERQRVLEREARLAEREVVLKQRLDDKLNERLREARAEVDRVVATLKQKTSALVQQAEHAATRRGPSVTTGDLGGLRSEARAALDAVGDSVLSPEDRPGSDTALDEPPSEGETVFVSTFNSSGIVRGVSGKNVEVDVRGKRVRVKLSDLRRAGQPAGPTPRSAPKGVSISTAARPGGAAARELVLIGSTVDEALARAEKFLDDALLADEKRLRVVHGHGTGKLREALTKFFREHPLVASAGPAADNEGGAGATIVELRD